MKHARNENYTRSLCGAPNPYIWRVVGSILLALPIVYVTMAMADGGYFSKPALYLLSPGFVLGLRAMKHANGFFDALGTFGRTAIPVNLIYWSSILFGGFCLRARGKTAK
jgi:hypothetical protein